MTETAIKKRPARRRDSVGFKIAAYLFMALFALWVLVPFYVILVTSFTLSLIHI